MPGRAVAVSNGAQLRDAVACLAISLGLVVNKEVLVGRRLWGAKRRIDVVVTDPRDRRRLGVECKYQAVAGTAEEKLPATVEDIRAWPIDGVVAFAGPGFSANMTAFLLSTGKAVEYQDLEIWLRLYFGLDLA